MRSKWACRNATGRRSATTPTGLEAYTSAEPLPWTDMLIKRARLLADAGEKGMSKQTRAGLEALRSGVSAHEARARR